MAISEGLYAEIITSKGEILVSLEFDKVPLIVSNFISLAEGSVENSSKGLGNPYYDGLIFHRVIDDFMIQAGCPEGTGTGGPGYNIQDEFDPELKHDRSGVVSMANAGPNTNGSQFFITHNETPWLDGKHSVFGYVEEGQDVVDKIVQGDKIESIRVIRKGASAEVFNNKGILENYLSAQRSFQQGLEEEQKELLKPLIEGFDELDGGLYIKIFEKGLGDNPKTGDTVVFHYKGLLLDQKLFDDSYQRGEPLKFKIGENQLIPGMEQGICNLQKGSKASLIIPPNLAYGEKGAGGVIPPNSYLIFEIEVLEIS